MLTDCTKNTNKTTMANEPAHHYNTWPNDSQKNTVDR